MDAQTPSAAGMEAVLSAREGNIHRIGGSSVENLRLEPREAELEPPGISLLKAPSPGQAAREVRAAFPEARTLHEAANVVGSTTADRIRGAGFGIIPNPTRKLPSHHRIVHPDGVAGFNEQNLKKLSEAFTDTTGH